MKLKPLEDRVIIKAVKEEEKTASGIVLPDTAKEKPMMGEVVAVGDGKWDEEGKKRIPVDVRRVTRSSTASTRAPSTRPRMATSS